jgi:hypothetical protein
MMGRQGNCRDQGMRDRASMAQSRVKTKSRSLFPFLNPFHCFFSVVTAFVIVKSYIFVIVFARIGKVLLVSISLSSAVVVVCVIIFASEKVIPSSVMIGVCIIQSIIDRFGKISQGFYRIIITGVVLPS